MKEFLKEVAVGVAILIVWHFILGHKKIAK